MEELGSPLNRRRDGERPLPEHHGRLEEHPRYEELVNKWGLVALKKRPVGEFARHFSGELSPRGYLLNLDGEETRWRVRDLLKEREWVSVDWEIREELHDTERFIDTG